jgi:hypothetical protein
MSVRASIAIAVCALSIAALADKSLANEPWSAQKAETMIRQNIPIGSDKAQVIQFLNKKGIENSGYLRKSATVYAIIRDTSGGPLIKGSVTMQFMFDGHGRLSHYQVEEVFTGP